MAERRRECGLTQAQLGALIGMTQGQLSNLERKNRPAGIGTALAIARALRTTVEALWAEDVSGCGAAALPIRAPKHRQPEAAAKRRSAPSFAGTKRRKR
jgi:putative transcriptional regulator